MTHATNADNELGTQGWHKPWSGSNNGNCLEVKRLGGGNVALRQSTDPRGPALICTPTEISQFIEAAKSGLADFLVT
ncbi:DUF397 domain-containing protein [Streptomyces sp. V2]|uniref:DUF397 domain-containing protein n=1 Tax=Streptomyces TaxID=1883 RepID=UPI0006EB295B|nr:MULTISPECIES: DUF397 domain-containing protein [Streptomyces]PWG13287.1 DUF397 domain-containing protein [Streptomyces sp. V2]QZZ25568.1 DUF397 domain-containing protein [Streptomyces sp. ST1015]